MSSDQDQGFTSLTLNSTQRGDDAPNVQLEQRLEETIRRLEASEAELAALNRAVANILNQGKVIENGKNCKITHSF